MDCAPLGIDQGWWAIAGIVLGFLGGLLIAKNWLQPINRFRLRLERRNRRQLLKAAKKHSPATKFKTIPKELATSDLVRRYVGDWNRGAGWALRKHVTAMVAMHNALRRSYGLENKVISVNDIELTPTLITESFDEIERAIRDQMKQVAGNPVEGKAIALMCAGAVLGVVGAWPC